VRSRYYLCVQRWTSILMTFALALTFLEATFLHILHAVNCLPVAHGICVGHHCRFGMIMVYAGPIDDAVHFSIRVGQQRPQAVVDPLLLHMLLSLLKRNTHA